MPHDLTTAPANPTPKWPIGYIEALREAGAQEKTIPFCIRWVRAFFAEHPGRRRRDLGRTEIEAFLQKTATLPNVTNWQVQQAREALEVYYERFRGIALAPRLIVPTAGREGVPGTQALAQTHLNTTSPVSKTDPKSPQPSHKTRGYTQRDSCVKAAVVPQSIAQLGTGENEAKIVAPSRSVFVQPMSAIMVNTGVSINVISGTIQLI